MHIFSWNIKNDKLLLVSAAISNIYVYFFFIIFTSKCVCVCVCDGLLGCLIRAHFISIFSWSPGYNLLWVCVCVWERERECGRESLKELHFAVVMLIDSSKFSLTSSSQGDRERTARRYVDYIFMSITFCGHDHCGDNHCQNLIAILRLP